MLVGGEGARGVGGVGGCVSQGLRGDSRRRGHLAAVCCPWHPLTEHTCARGQSSREHLPRLKLRQTSLPSKALSEVEPLGPAGASLSFLAGPPEYKRHSEVACAVVRHSAHRVPALALPAPVKAREYNLGSICPQVVSRTWEAFFRKAVS